jgi:hypothetical protein
MIEVRSMKTIDVVIPLVNIEKLNSPIKITDGLCICPLDETVREYIDHATSTGFLRNPSLPTAYLRILNLECDTNVIGEARAIADRVLLCLRLHRKGEVGYSMLLAAEAGCNGGKGKNKDVHIDWAALHHYSVWHRPGHSSPYVLSEEDSQKILQLYSATNAKTLRRPAFRHFLRSYHEPYATDRFLSCAIGLECALLSGQQERSSLSYKFRDRGAYILQQCAPDPNGACTHFAQLGQIYRKRSQLVHTGLGSSDDWKTSDELAFITKAEEYLRDILKYILANPKLADSSEIDRKKLELY